MSTFAKVPGPGWLLGMFTAPRLISYGRLPATIALNNGVILTQPPLPQTLSWIRNDHFDRKRPFLVTSDQE